MHQRVKWLLILVLSLLTHTAYIVAAVAPGPQDSLTYVIPFGYLKAGTLGVYIFPEIALTAAMIIVLAALPWSGEGR